MLHLRALLAGAAGGGGGGAAAAAAAAAVAAAPSCRGALQHLLASPSLVGASPPLPSLGAGVRGLASASSSIYADAASTGAAAVDEAGPASASDADAASSVMPKLVVFGARGFVGSHIAQEGLNSGLAVTGISRSGTPPVQREPWTQEVDWVRGNALEPRSFEEHLEGAAAVISTVGAFGSQADMLRTNGTANVTLIEAAAKAGVPRFVYVSAHIPNVPGLDMMLSGYVRGKAMAEAALREHYPEGGVALRPGVVYGNRVLSSSVTLPLQFVFQPLELLLQRFPTKQLAGWPLVGAAMVPPNSVASVGRAAVDAATNAEIASGVMDPWEIQKYNQ